MRQILQHSVFIAESPLIGTISFTQRTATRGSEVWLNLEEKEGYDEKRKKKKKKKG
jgi:hypothetical protein